MPEEGYCQSIIDLHRDVICAGDEFLFNWTEAWFAQMFQEPHKIMGTLIAMRGRQGIGKGTIAKILKRIIGRHFVHLSNHKHLTGNHNAHLMYALLAFCDEAFFAGDRAATGELKRIVTEETRMIEPKFVDAFEIRNYMRVLMATNRVLAMIEAVALLEIPAMSLALH